MTNGWGDQRAWWGQATNVPRQKPGMDPRWEAEFYQGKSTFWADRWEISKGSFFCQQKLRFFFFSLHFFGFQKNSAEICKCVWCWCFCGIRSYQTKWVVFMVQDNQIHLNQFTRACWWMLCKGLVFLGGGFKDLYLYLGKWSNLTYVFQMGWNHQVGFHWKSRNDRLWIAERFGADDLLGLMVGYRL